jgi:hypothetical protein
MKPSNEENYYEILGVAADVSQEIIVQAFYQLLNECQDNTQASEQKRALLEKAYYILGDEMRRYEYDRWWFGKQAPQSEFNNQPISPDRKMVPMSSPTKQIPPGQYSGTRGNPPIRKTINRQKENHRPSITTLLVLFSIVFIVGKLWSADNSLFSSFQRPEVRIPASNTNYSEPDQNMPALDLPPNGEVRYFQQAEAIAPFSIHTAPEVNYYIKLVDVETGKTVVTIFVWGGQSVKTQVPLGTYELRYATGRDWYGEEKIFGAETSCVQADKRMTFYINGSQIMGHTVSLIKRIDGNLHTHNINPSQF